MDNPDKDHLQIEIEKGTALCVKCGKCLSVCPTYQTSLNEAESPRGRISLMQGLISQQLSLSPKLKQHLDQCLACRNCESICPAKVPYGALIDQTRALMYQEDPTSHHQTIPKWLVILTQSRQRRHQLRALLKILITLRLIPLWHAMPRLPFLKFMFAKTDLIPSSIKLAKPPQSNSCAKAVMLFSSCVSECLDMTTQTAAKHILQTLNYEVLEPTIACCGALFRHHGQFTTANNMAHQVLEACQNHKTQTLLTLASGCGTQIKEYPHQLNAHNIPLKVIDFCHWLLQNEHFLKTKLQPFPHTLWLHQPCTLRNGFNTADSTEQLLTHIPNLIIKPLPSLGCCGASGLHLLNNPSFSKQFLEPLAQALTKDKPSIIVSSNIGCVMHLQRFLREKSYKIPVIHPVTLLWKQMQA